MKSSNQEILLSQIDVSEFFSIKEASKWASTYLNKIVSPSNISYLVQYGKIKKYIENNSILVSKNDLVNYYNSFNGKREINWKKQLGDDLNWHLSFDHLREKDTTKHVHRLHPYKGKFIPQLVEYFIDSHTDEFKKEIFFQKNDIILDPFCGSGTALVQANELGINAIGIDISEFNSLISNVKISNYDLYEVSNIIHNINNELKFFDINNHVDEFEKELQEKLYLFNNKYFPGTDFRYDLNQGKIDEKKYSSEKEKEFLNTYNDLLKKYNIKLKNKKNDNFLDKWYIKTTRDEISKIYEIINKINNPKIKKLVYVILSRTIRSCRATTHSDLATLKEPQLTTYYCFKHKKICKPLFSIFNKWNYYSKDTLVRINKFSKLRTNTFQICLTGDSRNIDIFKEIKSNDKAFYDILINKKINGIFSSPPYVGLIDYHEQHAYAYELFGLKRRDVHEIGPLFNGYGKEARDTYVKGISDVLNNCKKYLIEDYNVFLVANDKYNLYPIIAGNAGMKIVNQYKRPVLNRTERDKAAYSEIIFHMKEK